MTTPLLLSQEDAAKLAGIGRDAMRRLVADGEVGHVRVGGRVRVSREEVAQWVRRATVNGHMGESHEVPV